MKGVSSINICGIDISPTDRIINKLNILDKEDGRYVLITFIDNSTAEISLSNLMDNFDETEYQPLPHDLQVMLDEIMRYNAEHPERLVDIYTEMEKQEETTSMA